jgi:mono/diheme cytochrome c family protein
MDYLKRMRRSIISVPTSGVLLVTSWGLAHAAGDPAKGKATAERWCTSCHTVSSSRGGSDTAPNFVSIAQMRDDNYLRGVLAEPHPPMPPIALSRYQIDDLVAYFGALRTQ